MGGSLITASYSSCPWTRLAYLLVEKTGVRFVCDILVVSSSLIVLVREASTWSWNRLPSPLSGNLIPSLWQPSQPSSTTPSASTLMAQRSSSMRSTQKSRSSSTFVALASQAPNWAAEKAAAVPAQSSSLSTTQPQSGWC